MAPSTTVTRLRYLDWTRGLAALIMLQGHTFHSFTRADLRESGPYVLSQFLGGIAPAVFLFLTGVTMAFRMDTDAQRGLKPVARVTSALSRARYLLVIALLFRIQLWIFSAPHGPLASLWKVDVLNCMALAGATLAILAVFTTADRARMGITAGVAIAALSPLVSQLDWSRVPSLLKNYIAPDYLFFGFFPWAAFFAFGLSAGSIIRLLRDDQMDRAMQWGALLGAGLIVGGRYFSEIPYSLYTKSDFWLDSPALILIKLGILLWILAFAFLWTRYAVGPSWSLVSQLGTTSLLVYWVHIELVYGRWFGSWKENLDITQVTAFSVILIAAMVLLSVLRTSARKWSAMPAALRWYPFTAPRPN
jgi:peptidoglycan/LPS O-acetylase OafA/YrhL